MPTTSIITVGISGAPSAGKSTLLYLLKEILQPVFALQLDDFCKEFEDLPHRPNGGLDADAVESIHFPAFIQTLKHCKENGHMPSDHSSWQDPAAVRAEHKKALASVPGGMVEEFREKVASAGAGFRIGIVDGFLLFQSTEVRELLDVKMLLRVSKATALDRRMKRPGYGDPKSADFWRTPEYFHECVWGNYVKEHSWLFEGGDVEGKVKARVADKLGIDVQKDLDAGFDDSLRWVMGRVLDCMEGL
ncbi:ribosylnicotinamide kinase [Agyrium rufum]|nr:ribosylnicotinamide kinase [Agyrium rufum]